ncbi:hypothetical protein PsorP6_013286 [Peronosclerospora sorghi]|uniref:Uncharacterized protein n=1 Tax=Peronosclerospora sorghi TaxID=230839 RepID=A0ACC0WGK8_9STRA|nr:hypothetical protein PsorP6_013286 [Peronosclerospora sorghi]
MVAIATSSSPFEAPGATVVAPLLVSPIAFAQRTRVLDKDARKSSSGNLLRDQWVANLQKKRTAALAGTSDPIGSGNPCMSFVKGTSLSASSTTSNNSSNTSSAVKRSSRSRSTAKRCSRRRSAASQRAKTRKSAPLHDKSIKEGISHRPNPFDPLQVPSGLRVDSQLAMTQEGGMTMGPSSMLFSDIDYLDLESPSFARLIASSLDDNLFSSPTASSSSSTNERTSKLKRGPMSGLKKRATHCLALDDDQAKPGTPRRKLNCGSATFDDFNLAYTIDFDSLDCLGVGTLSTFNADAPCAHGRHPWSQELPVRDAGEDAATFLDLGTSRLEMSKSPPSHDSTKETRMELDDERIVCSDLDTHRLPRTRFTEQDRLSHVLEQTNLDDRKGHDVWPVSLTNGSKSPFPGGTLFASMPDANDVGECLGIKVSSLSSSSPVPCFSKPDGRGSRTCVSSGKTNQLSELDTMMDEYKFTDLDQELDSFYLDTMDSIDTAFDLPTN